MTSLEGAPDAIASAEASIWNRNGTGSSSWGKSGENAVRKDEGISGEAYLWFEFVYERFQNVFGDIGRQIDGWCQG